MYLKENLKIKTTIKKKGLFVFPAGPALASIEQSKKYYGVPFLFLAKDQAPINTFIDEVYLGWLKKIKPVRLMFNPIVFSSTHYFYLGWFVRLQTNLWFKINSNGNF